MDPVTPIVLLGVSLIARATGAFDLADAVETGASIWDRLRIARQSRQGRAIVDDLQKLIGRELAHEFRFLEPESLRCAADAVTDSLQALASLEPYELGASAQSLRTLVENRGGSKLRTALGDQGTRDCFDFLLISALAYISRAVRSSPAYQGVALAQTLNVQSRIADDLLRTRAEIALLQPRLNRGDLVAQSRRYLARLVNVLDHLDLPGLEADAGALSLSATYAPPNFRILPSGDPAASGPRRNRGKTLLTGASGSGKTTWVKAEATELALAALDAADLGALTVPLIVKARRIDFANIEKSIQDQVVAGQFDAPSGTWVSELIEFGRCVLFIDGLDEVEPREGSLLMDWLDSVHSVSRVRPPTIVVCARSQGHVQLRHGWTTFVIDPLGVGEAAALARRVYEGVTKKRGRTILEGHIPDGGIWGTSARALQSIADTPLVCASIIRLWLEGDRVTEVRGPQLVEAILNMLISFRDEERDVLKATEMPLRVLNEAVEELAWAIETTRHRPFRRADALRLLGEVARQSKTDWPRAGRVLDALAGTGSILEPVQAEVEFRHSLYRQYLAGRHAAHSTNPDLVVELATGGKYDSLDWAIQSTPTARHVSVHRALRALSPHVLSGEVRARVLLKGHPNGNCHQEDRAKYTSDLIPPRCFEDQSSLAHDPVTSVGALAGYLASLKDYSPATPELHRSIDTLIQLGGEAAWAALVESLGRFGSAVDRQIVQGWSQALDARYANVVLGRALALGLDFPLEITDGEAMAAIDSLPREQRVFVRAGPEFRFPPALPIRHLEDVRLDNCSWSGLETFLNGARSIGRLTATVVGGEDRPQRALSTLGVKNVVLKAGMRSGALRDLRLSTNDLVLAAGCESLTIAGIRLDPPSDEAWHLPSSLKQVALLGTGYFNRRGTIDADGLRLMHVDDISSQSAPTLGVLPRLEHLRVSGSWVSELPFLADLTSLRYLDVSNTQFTDLATLEYLSDPPVIIAERGQLDVFLAELSGNYVVQYAGAELEQVSLLRRPGIEADDEGYDGVSVAGAWCLESAGVDVRGIDVPGSGSRDLNEEPQDGGSLDRDRAIVTQSEYSHFRDGGSSVTRKPLADGGAWEQADGKESYEGWLEGHARLVALASEVARVRRGHSAREAVEDG